jgi:aromatic ring-cleaving dioxygenase
MTNISNATIDHAEAVPDLYVQNDGSIFVVHPLTPPGKKFLRHECQSESWQWLGEALSVDHHMIGAIVQVAQDQGLVVE